MGIMPKTESSPPAPGPTDVLMDAAFRVFAQQGYRATRLDDVADAVGLTKGAIYYHFEGKEDLLRRAVQVRHRAIFGEIATALEGERAPAAARIRFNRVIARLESGDRSGAAAEISELTRQFPAFSDGWKLLATLSHESGQAADAVTAWQRVLALDPRDLDVLFNLAVTLRQLGRTEEARDAARRFLESAPQPAYNRERAIVAPLAAPRP